MYAYSISKTITSNLNQCDSRKKNLFFHFERKETEQNLRREKNKCEKAG